MNVAAMQRNLTEGQAQTIVAKLTQFKTSKVNLKHPLSFRRMRNHDRDTWLSDLATVAFVTDSLRKAMYGGVPTENS